MVCVMNYEGVFTFLLIFGKFSSQILFIHIELTWNTLIFLIQLMLLSLWVNFMWVLYYHIKWNVLVKFN